MKTLVLGAGGLLGSHLVKAYDAVGVSRTECNILSPLDLTHVIERYHPDVVINCAGVVPRSPFYQDSFHTYQINSLAPHFISKACDSYGARLIHISTDCVFSGMSGHYTEDEVPNPPDTYGMSKYLGEITYLPHLTIRTSFVGLPDPTKRGLLHWAQGERRMYGYDRVWWNGLTTIELGRIIFEEILRHNVTGLLHLYGETLTKYDLLIQAKEVFDFPGEVLPESKYVHLPRKINKTLDSVRGFTQTTKSFKQQLEEMRDLWKTSP